MIRRQPCDIGSRNNHNTTCASALKSQRRFAVSLDSVDEQHPPDRSRERFRSWRGRHRTACPTGPSDSRVARAPEARGRGGEGSLAQRAPIRRNRGPGESDGVVDCPRCATTWHGVQATTLMSRAGREPASPTDASTVRRKIRTILSCCSTSRMSRRRGPGRRGKI